MTKAGEACDPPAAWKELYVAWEGPCPAAGGGAGRAGSCQPTAVPCSPVTAPGCRPCLWVWEPSFDDGILQEGVSLYPSLGLGCTFRFRLGPENPRPVGTSPICPPGDSRCSARNGGPGSRPHPSVPSYATPVRAVKLRRERRHLLSGDPQAPQAGCPCPVVSAPTPVHFCGPHLGLLSLSLSPPSGNALLEGKDSVLLSTAFPESGAWHVCVKGPR